MAHDESSKQTYTIQTLGPDGAVTHKAHGATPCAGLGHPSLSPWRDGAREGTADAYVTGPDGQPCRVGRVRVRVLRTGEV